LADNPREGVFPEAVSKLESALRAEGAALWAAENLTRTASGFPSSHVVKIRLQ
jgi:hypothetical protein